MKICKISQTKRFQKKVNIPNERVRSKYHFKPIIIGGGHVEVEKDTIFN